MRQVERWRRRFADALKGQYEPTGDQPAVSALMDIEASLYLLETVTPGQAASGVPSLLDGYRAAWDVVDKPADDAHVRLANARIVLWRRTQRPYRWDNLLTAYSSVPEHIRGYNLDELGRPVRRVCRVAPQRWDWYEELLTDPLPFATTTVRYAGPGTYRMGSTAFGQGVTIPQDLPGFAPSAVHDLRPRPRGPIHVTWKELMATARSMDTADCALGRSRQWEARLQEVMLQVRADDDTFADSDIVTIDTMLHAVGMVSVGKTTLVVVLAVWAAQHGHTVTIVLGDNSLALRTTADLSAYPGVKPAPVLGLNRARHTERLHRLQPPPTGSLLPAEPFGFDMVSTACGLSAVREAAVPLNVKEAPCEKLVTHDPDAPADGWRDRPAHTCPLWHGCQRHHASRELADANIWVATPWSLVHTKVPAPMGGTQIRYLEAAWRRSDLVIIDEADHVQANFDGMFANAQVLLGASEEAWIDEIDDRVARALRSSGRAQTTSKQIRRFKQTTDHARTAADLIYQMLQRDRTRPGRPLLNWIDTDYFTAWALFNQLAQDWSGHASSSGGRPRDGWEDDPIYLLLRDEFNKFIDDPTNASDGIAGELSSLAIAQLADPEEESREDRVRHWLTVLTERELLPNRTISPSNRDRSVWRLEFALAVAVMAHRLDLMLAMWPQAAADLDMYDAITAEVRRPPTDLTAVMPESPMGNVLGFQYVEDDEPAGTAKLGEFRFFRYSGVGRTLLLDLPDLFPADGPGPNVLLLSGTSWAGTSPRYHIDIPVTAILRPSEDKLAQIAKTTFAREIQRTPDGRAPIWVSGRYGEARAAALQQMVQALTRPGAGPHGLTRLERERDALPEGRKKIMLLVGSYAEARTVKDALVRAKSSWKGQVKCLIGDDELETGWDDTDLLRRGDVAEFGIDAAWLLLAPILAVERGHNILNDEGVAAIGAAFFLVRPHPRPKDLSYVTQRINQYARQQLRYRYSGDAPPHERLRLAGEDRRRAAQREWRHLLHAMVAYSRLDDVERNRVAWTQLVTIWQVIGRLLRGGQAAKVYFCDAAFAPKSAHSDGDLDDANTSLLVGMREVLAPYFDPTSSDPDRFLVQALYQPLYQALSAMGDR